MVISNNMKRLNLNFVIEFQEFGFKKLVSSFKFLVSGFAAKPSAKKLVSSFRVQVSRNWFLGSGFRFQVLVSGFRNLVSSFKLQVSRNWFQGSGFRFQEIGFRFHVPETWNMKPERQVPGSGFGVLRFVFQS